MLGRSHAVLGIASTSVVLTGTGTNIIEDTTLFVICMTVGTIAALLPDIDSQNNFIRDSFRVGSSQTRRELRRWRRKNLIEKVIALIRWIIARLLDVIDRWLPHRGPTHFGITALVLTGLVLLLGRAAGWPDLVAYSFGIGYFSHLVGDGVTKAGVRLFAPFYNKSVGFLPRSLRIRTGTFQEGLMLGVMVGGMVGLLFYFATATS